MGLGFVEIAFQKLQLGIWGKILAVFFEVGVFELAVVEVPVWEFVTALSIGLSIHEIGLDTEIIFNAIALSIGSVQQKKFRFTLAILLIRSFLPFLILHKIAFTLIATPFYNLPLSQNPILKQPFTFNTQFLVHSPTISTKSPSPHFPPILHALSPRNTATNLALKKLPLNIPYLLPCLAILFRIDRQPPFALWHILSRLAFVVDGIGYGQLCCVGAHVLSFQNIFSIFYSF